MYDYDALMERYQQKLQEAVTKDERAQAAHAHGKKQEAASQFGEAAVLYAEAADMLLCVLENCSIEDEDHFKRSIDRLLEISGLMKDMAAKDAAGKREEISKNAGKTVSADEENAEFSPAANLPDVRFSDIAGLEDAKQLVLDKIINPVLYEDLYREFGVRCRGGLMLYGPPGGGKTMLARAIATESGFAFFHARCSDIVGKYFGEAEKHVRSLFQAAREAKNAVVFLDEAEALACRRGGNSTVMARLVPELLTQMDGFDDFPGHLIVVFATNRPYDIDPAFLRPGRMSALCYVPLPDYEVRLHLLRVQLDSRPCEEGINLEELAKQTERFSCADLVNLVDTCAQYPLNRSIEHRKNGNEAAPEKITLEDVKRALEAIGPSVEEAELKRLDKWTASRKLPQAV